MLDRVLTGDKRILLVLGGNGYLLIKFNNKVIGSWSLTWNNELDKQFVY